MIHTKGPWKAHPYNSKMGTLISFGDINRGENIGIVCAQKDADEAKGNAALIVSAPDLFEALKACHLQLLQSGCNHEYTQEACGMAYAAIAKAEGK